MLSSVEKWTCFLRKRKGENTQKYFQKEKLICFSQLRFRSKCFFTLPYEASQTMNADHSERVEAEEIFQVLQ